MLFRLGRQSQTERIKSTDQARGTFDILTAGDAHNERRCVYGERIAIKIRPRWVCAGQRPQRGATALQIRHPKQQ